MSISVVTQLAPTDSLESFTNLLDSVSFADDITVYAMDIKGSKELAKITRDYNLTVKYIEAPTVVEHIRAQQVQDAKGDWVLIMDFDEVVTPELRDEIIALTGMPSRSSSERRGAYSIARENFSLGYPLRYGGWGTDYVIRLFRRADFIDWPTDIHSTPTFRGELGQLASHMEHHKDQSLEYIVTKTNRYSNKEASQFYEGGMRSVTSFTLLRKLKMEMIRRGIFKKGLLDGKIGLIQSIYQGFSVFISYAKLYELQRKQQEN